MTKKIIFRADGSSTTGLGHLYRLFSLVEIVKDTFEFVFLTHETSTVSVVPKKYNKEFIPESIKTENEPEWLSANYSPQEHIIIADGYQFISSYQKEIKQKGYSLIYIDDLAQEHMYADVVINHSPYIHHIDYKKEAYTKLALGTKYALLRPLFLKEAKQNRVINVIDSAFVCFGGADPFNLSMKAVESLLQISNFKNIHVVLGAAYKHTEILSLEEKYSGKIKTYRDLCEEDLIKTMQLCNFAIAPSSTIVYELCSIKLPILSGYFVDNQRGIYDSLLNLGAIYGGGSFINYTIQDFKVKVEEIIKHNDINHFIKNQKRLFSGDSKNNLLKLLNPFLITFRLAKLEDMLMVYNLSNDETVRYFSYNSDPIILESHKKWFENKLTDKKCLFLIVLFNNESAGIVRYEMNDKYATVGVLIAKKFRGKKLASYFLRESAKKYFKQNHLPIFAYIKKDNKASIKSFENSGYSFYKEENVKGKPSLIYKLEKNHVKE